ncbi:4,5-DOPA dioxygenase extradiol [Candidatus Cryosericum hinesii]|jgi:4,5-DOPA dioxygenase extradiol|nr:4,5-DOPA dioxygenase extradiol [Candidatus Cryosericum hinesii]
MMNKKRMPALFLAHGSPMNIIEWNTFTEALLALSGSLPHPTGIIVISAHWQTRGTQVTCTRQPRTMHDFSGFPDELYHIGYPCPGSPEMAERVRAALGPGVVSCDMERGLDHGAWSVQHHMYPLAFIPVIQISLDVSLTSEERMELGKRLSPLRDEGVLILGSGNVVHNLGLVDLDNEQAPAYTWAQSFDSWVAGCVESNHLEELTRYRLAPFSELAVPTDEHYIPLLYVAGLRRSDDMLTTVFEGFQNASLSMRCIRVG